ncbi:MAG: hypothetical protein HC905_15780, partial [Bacteroidales bacterium]|nr:hypothetical protein [Bacteroidales bacterium]
NGRVHQDQSYRFTIAAPGELTMNEQSPHAQAFTESDSVIDLASDARIFDLRIIGQHHSLAEYY